MSQPPKHSLRWVVIDPDLIRQALEQHAESSGSIDLRADAFGFGASLVGEIARDLGLDLAGSDSRWVEKAHALGAQRLHTQVLNLKRVPAGSAISYGGHYQTAVDTNLALCAVGFADGVPRLDPVGGEVEIDGHRFPIAGRIAMDQMIVDVGDSNFPLGHTVTVWGEAVGLSEWASWSKRSALSIGSALSPRVARVVEAGSRG